MTLQESPSDPPPILSLLLSYRFGEGSAAEYLTLNSEQKREVDAALLRELLQTFTFPVRQSWIELATGPEFEYLDHEQIRSIVNEQLATLAISGRPKWKARIPETHDSSAFTEAMYLIIPPREHRTTNVDGLVLNHGDKQIEWRLDQTVLDKRWTPRVVSALSIGFPIEMNAMPPADRADIHMDGFFGAMVDLVVQFADRTDTALPIDFENPLRTPDPHDVGRFHQLAAEWKRRRTISRFL